MSSQRAQTSFNKPSQPAQSTSSQQDQTMALNSPRRRKVSHIRGEVITVKETTLRPISIFSLLQSLIATKQECYIPQHVAMGPYHQWRPELFSMERQKISAARSIHEKLGELKLSNQIKGQKFDFEDLVGLLRNSCLTIRSHYDRYIDIGEDELAWIMAVDASFLLRFLQKLTDGISVKISPKESVIIRDIMMLENQIPLIHLHQILCVTSDRPDEEFNKILGRFCKELTPFKKDKDFTDTVFTDHVHLLEVLYFILLRKIDKSKIISTVEDARKVPSNARKKWGWLPSVISKIGKANPTPSADTEAPRAEPSVQCMALLPTAEGCLSFLNKGPIGKVTRPVTVLLKLPWTVIRSLPQFSWLIRWLKSEDADSMEEITIPSASDLIHAGVRFVATDGGLSTVRFDGWSTKFYLPVITLDVNTEVTLRNLVAYESATSSDYMVCRPYIQLMDGIIKTGEDAAILRGARIVYAPYMIDTEVASIWIGMRKSVRLVATDANHVIDKAIIAVNNYYNSHWRVKAKKAMKRCVFGWWQCLTFVAAIVLLLLTGFQAFCSVYACHRWFRSIRFAPSND